MSPTPHAMRLTGATILRDGEMQRQTVTIANGRIGTAPRPGPEVDLGGYLVLPGIVDIHGSAFERHIAPGPEAMPSLGRALVATDREAAASGVTTGWLAQGWSWEGGHHAPEFAESLLHALDTCRPRLQTELRVQLRCETHTVDTRDRLLEAVKRHAVDFVVFNNHLDAALHPARGGDADLVARAMAAGRSADRHRAAIREARKQAPAVPRYLCTLAAAFDAMGVRYGSHGDRDAETRSIHSMIGARICLFPATRGVARLARASGDPVATGAPAAIRGGEALVTAGQSDLLVSDDRYPALAATAFRLADDGPLDLPAAWRLISERPAEIMRLGDRGAIEEGRRADLVIVNETTHDIEATLVEGRISHLTGAAARRFLGALDRPAVAAE